MWRNDYSCGGGHRSFHDGTAAAEKRYCKGPKGLSWCAATATGRIRVGFGFRFKLVRGSRNRSVGVVREQHLPSSRLEVGDVPARMLTRPLHHTFQADHPMGLHVLPLIPSVAQRETIYSLVGHSLSTALSPACAQWLRLINRGSVASPRPSAFRGRVLRQICRLACSAHHRANSHCGSIRQNSFTRLPFGHRILPVLRLDR